MTPERGDLADAKLVEDLAGLLLAPRVELAAEPLAQDAQGLLGDGGVEGEDLEGGDDAVAAEERGEPRDARGVELVAVEGRAEHPQVEQRALHDAVEELVVGADARALGQPGVGAGPSAARRRPGGGGSERLPAAERVAQADRGVLPGLEGERPPQGRLVDVRGRGVRRDRRRPADAVARDGAEDDAVGTRRDVHRRGRHVDDAAQREHRAEVGRQRELEVELERGVAVEVDDDELLEGVAAEPPLEAHLQRLERHEPAAGQLEVGVRRAR